MCPFSLDQFIIVVVPHVVRMLMAVGRSMPLSLLIRSHLPHNWYERQCSSDTLVVVATTSGGKLSRGSQWYLPAAILALVYSRHVWTMLYHQLKGNVMHVPHTRCLLLQSCSFGAAWMWHGWSQLTEKCGRGHVLDWLEKGVFKLWDPSSWLYGSLTIVFPLLLLVIIPHYKMVNIDP